MEFILSFLVALVGALIYTFAANPKIQNMGLISFGCGLLAGLVQIGGAHIGFIR